MPRHIDLTGQKFGDITVIRYLGESEWFCRCICGKPLIITTGNLRTGGQKSCGCRRNSNVYEFHDDYFLILYPDGSEAIFDSEDFDIIKKHYWSKDHSTNHLISSENHSQIQIGRYILLMNGYCLGDNVVDHINRNPLDNRKCNLRVCSQQQNTINRSLRNDNTSGKSGVTFHKRIGKWQSNVYLSGKRYHLGYFDNKEDAIAARLEGEEKYFGEFAPK